MIRLNITLQPRSRQIAASLLSQHLPMKQLQIRTPHLLPKTSLCGHLSSGDHSTRTRTPHNANTISLPTDFSLSSSGLGVCNSGKLCASKTSQEPRFEKEMRQ